MVAEKPSLAAYLANILSNGQNTSRKGESYRQIDKYDDNSMNQVVLYYLLILI